MTGNTTITLSEEEKTNKGKITDVGTIKVIEKLSPDLTLTLSDDTDDDKAIILSDTF